ncbi:MAG: hypothetical protein K2W95_26320 [Candidatus Obscuribacterales bacterium]|nr:hypothetical protein [Candidatus Obscuribacterales bacterium]
MFFVSLLLFTGVCLWLRQRYVVPSQAAPVRVWSRPAYREETLIGEREARGAVTYMIR